jgi:ribosome-associated protein
MAKRKDKGFQWVREDQDGAAKPRIERAIRQREKDETKELENWVRRLAEQPASTRARLPLSDEVKVALTQYAGLSRTPARGRLARRITQLLRHEDMEAVEANLDGDGERDQLLRALERWRDRLIKGGDTDLQAFVEEYEAADRQRIRALARQARGEGRGAAKASKALFQILKTAAEA